MRYAGFLAIALVVFNIPAALAASQPLQPATGPGSSEAFYTNMQTGVYGSGDTQYWLFEPKNGATTARPVIVFNHGYSAMTPGMYQAWINHLVQRGNVVIYPRYQASLSTSPSTFTNNAITAVKNALIELNQPGHVQIDLSHFGIVGHSNGGMITANMAALASSSGLPVPRAIAAIAPGNSWGPASVAIPMADMRGIPASALLITVAGSQDNIVGSRDAQTIYHNATTVNPSNKNFITVNTDNYGSPALVADHYAPDAPLTPITPGETDALDFYAYWKLTDAIISAAFYNTYREYALGNTPQQTNMGNWSDGHAVKKMTVVTTP